MSTILSKEPMKVYFKRIFLNIQDHLRNIPGDPTAFGYPGSSKRALHFPQIHNQ